LVQQAERSRPPGRNDPCPCGSGKKYKRCCLAADTPVVAVLQLSQILDDLRVADEAEDALAAVQILESARTGLHPPDVDTMLVERYLQLPPEEAEEALRAWWDREHDRFSGAGLAQTLVAQDRKDEALYILAESQGTGAWPEYWHLLATLRDEQGDTEAAIAAMELYTRLASENADAWMALADMHVRAGQHDRALITLRRAGDLVPGHIGPRLQRLRILTGEGWWREARDLAEALLEGRYDDSTPESQYELRNILARAHFIFGDFDAARKLWESMLADQPGDGDIRYELAELERMEQRHRRVLMTLEAYTIEAGADAVPDLRVLDLRLSALLALHEYDGATSIAEEIENLISHAGVTKLVQAAQAVSTGEYAWAVQQLSGDCPERYRDLWFTLRLDSLAHLGRWKEVLPALRFIARPDDLVLVKASLAAMAAGQLDIAERLLEKIEDQQSPEARNLTALLGPLRQSRRAEEVRRQQQVDQAERQKWTVEARELRRRIKDLEQHNAGLADALALSDSTLERLLERVGVTAEDSGANWEVHMQGMAEREHKRALKQELQGAERRLRSQLGQTCWDKLSENVRASLREGEWLFAAVEGEDRDYGASLLEFARGLERAFKDAIFVPGKAAWQRRPGPVERLQDEAHDPSLGPFVRFVLQGSHLTLGSMAAALDRMSDIRRQGFAITLLRRQLGVDPLDERALSDWKRIADRLAIAAEARNQPAHAAFVTREAVREFRDLVLGTDGLIRSLYQF
jgi:tetratricopeptide (TPR) repeat protein